MLLAHPIIQVCLKLKLKKTKQKQIDKRNKKGKNVQLEHNHEVCELSNFPRLLSNKYFFNFS